MSEQVKYSPIKPMVPAVFVYVRDVRKSVEWYCSILNLPLPDSDRTDIHIFPLDDCSNIFLVGREEVHPSREPLFSLTAPDHEATYRFLQENDVEIVSKNEETIYFKDLDGNVLMACAI